jgi:hypothetical protein
MPRFKDVLQETQPGSGMVANPYAAYRLDEQGNKVWIEGETDIDFLDTHLGDLLPAQVPTVAQSKIQQMKDRVDANLGGSPGLKLLLDHLSETGQL